MTTEPLDLDELVEHWTLLDGDHELVGAETISRIEQLLAVDDDYEDDEGRDVLALVKAAPGN